MDSRLAATLRAICAEVHDDHGRLLDILIQVQRHLGYVGPEAIDTIAQRVKLPRVVVAGAVTFYSFLSPHPRGATVIRLCNDIIDEHAGMGAVRAAFCRELGIDIGECTPDRRFSLETTSCIGMSDQAPAALIDSTVITHLHANQVAHIVHALRTGTDLIQSPGDGNNAHPLVHAMVQNNIRRVGPVLRPGFQPGSALRRALVMGPEAVISAMKRARLRGRGGAGFPTGMKWDFVRRAPSPPHHLICNADEGEPGSFKDRVLLTEHPDLLFEGMTLAGYAMGADQGLLYLRGEYAYLEAFLQSILEQRRRAGLLGASSPFRFDIRVQRGAGAYICGEETALLSSCEGRRGDPRTRPPFPTQSGYRGCPTAINNVETLCCAARIIEQGVAAFVHQGTHSATGTKLLSVSGDCRLPGVYEVPFGIPLAEVLAMAGTRGVQAIQVGGASGTMVGPDALQRRIDYNDLPTEGAVTVFDHRRDLLGVVEAFMRFFVAESCGYCTPCRVGNGLLLDRIGVIRDGKGELADIEYLRELCDIIRCASRCGLGQNAPAPILSTLDHFPHLYRERCPPPQPGGRKRSFDIQAHLAEAESIGKRKSELFAR